MLSKEDYESLIEIESDFNKAVYSGYKMPTRPIWDGKVEKIYQKYLRPEAINWSCGHCGFRAYQQVGTLYFEAKAHYTAEEEEKNKKGKK